MTDPNEVSKIEAILRSHPGCTFVFHPAGHSFPERFSVSIPMDPVYGGFCWGDGATLDHAYCVALERHDDRIARRAA